MFAEHVLGAPTYLSSGLPVTNCIGDQMGQLCLARVSRCHNFSCFDDFLSGSPVVIHRYPSRSRHGRTKHKVWVKYVGKLESCPFRVCETFPGQSQWNHAYSTFLSLVMETGSVFKVSQLSFIGVSTIPLAMVSNS